jgi:transposase
VKAVAMDMNASYNALVKEYLLEAEIVYDRYHVQAQFGRDVLGKVRLDAERAHKETAKAMSSDGGLKQQIQQEKKLYSKIKKARWVLLQNKENLCHEKQQSLNVILDTHSDLAVCYAMKE